MKQTDKDFQKKYKIFSDDELISLIHQGDLAAEEYMIRKYKNLVNDRVSNFYIIGADKDDLIQEGMIGLYNAIRDYKVVKEAKFKTYAYKCIQNQLINAVKASTRQKHEPLNEYVSIDDIDISNEQNPESILIAKDYMNFLEEKLSKFEIKVLYMHLEGDTYKDIAEKLGKNKKDIDNAVQRIRIKLKQIINRESRVL